LVVPVAFPVLAQDGIHLAIEFTKTEEAEIKQLRKLL
jgi:hypothetical protein